MIRRFKMKNIFKKNQIIITALAIMIVIAGYLSFTNNDKPDDNKTTLQETDPDLEALTDVDGTELATGATTGTGTTDTGATGARGTGTDTTLDTTAADTTGTDENKTTDTNATDTNTDNNNNNAADELGDISDQDILEASQDVTDNGELKNEDGVPGEAVLANANTLDAGFFVSEKLKREQTRAANKATLLDIIESTDITKDQKQKAVDAMLQITSIADKERATETLLAARGFDDALVNIVDGQVDVVINAATLSDQQLAIIEDVIKQKTEVTVEHINIIPAVVAE
jgi:stage III sporulation protein AH